MITKWKPSTSGTRKTQRKPRCLHRRASLNTLSTLMWLLLRMVWGHPRLNLAHASIIRMQEPCRESLLTSLMECHRATLGFHSCIMIRLHACMQLAQRLSSPVSSTKSKFGLMMCAGTLNLGSLLQCRCSTSAWSSSISQ